MKEITSAHNPLIKYLKKLHQTKFRKTSGHCLVEGLRACEEFLRSPHALEQFFVTAALYQQTLELVQEAKVTLVPESLMKEISQATTPSGIVGLFALAEQPKRPLTAGLVLAQIQDPGNMGTLIRTAAACKVPAIVIVEGCDPWSHKVVQSSAGTIAHAPLHILSWNELIQNKGTLPLAACVVSDGSDARKEPLKDVLLVIGNEANGLPEKWEQQCEKRITLPMPGGTESLNAAVAGSILLYMAYVS